MKNLKNVLAVILFSASFVSAYCHILKVPNDYTTIQSAIIAAQKGDTVLVDTGRYYENINFRGKSIVVASKYLLTKDTSFISKTIIDGSKPTNPDTASCVLLISAEDSNTVLQGFTITKGKGTPILMNGNKYVEGGGIYLHNSNAVIKNNIIVDNTVTAGGGGIASWGGKCQILNNIIVNNTAQYAAGIVLNWADGIIKNNIIYHNNKVGSKWLTGGIMVWDSQGHPIIENNTIIGNISSTSAGGISITNASSPVILNNIIWANRQNSGPQISGAKTNSVTYCDTEDAIAGEGNIKSFPLFKSDTFTLAAGSPCIDAGININNYSDKENSLSPGQALPPSSGTIRNDMGAFGGMGAEVLNNIHVEDIYVLPSIQLGKLRSGESLTKKFEVLNLGTSDLRIDSITLQKKMLTIENGKDIKTIKCLKSDSISITWRPSSIGTFEDTLKIYHSIKSLENPKQVIIKGEVLSPITQINNVDKKVDILNVSPNPCTTNCIIKYRVDNECLINLSLFDIGGKKLFNLTNSKKNAGDYQFEFKRQGLKNGVYIIRYISSNGTISNNKLVIN